MKIDKELAERALNDAFRASRETSDVIHRTTRIERLVAACEGAAKTHIAFLGTAILAKAVDLTVDAFAVKHSAFDPKKQSGAYSARSLAHGVLVPFATEFGIDLGVSGREPLNNQPYFRMNRVDDNTPVLGSSKAAMEVLKQILLELNSLKTRDAAMAALQAFLKVRTKRRRSDARGPEQVSLSADELLALIKQFTGSNSEGGKRVQAVVAGLLDVFAGDGRVDAGRINDPSRHYPGDIVVYSEEKPDQIEKAFEVRDKVVTLADILIFGARCTKEGVREIAVAALSLKQTEIDALRVSKWASDQQVSVTVFSTWEEIVKQTLFWSPTPGPEAAAEAAIAIRRRLIEVEVSENGVREWDRLLKRFQ